VILVRGRLSNDSSSVIHCARSSLRRFHNTPRILHLLLITVSKEPKSNTSSGISKEARTINFEALLRVKTILCVSKNHITELTITLISKPIEIRIKLKTFFCFVKDERTVIKEITDLIAISVIVTQVTLKISIEIILIRVVNMRTVIDNTTFYRADIEDSISIKIRETRSDLAFSWDSIVDVHRTRI
jgi:hypothetical protein